MTQYVVAALYHFTAFDNPKVWIDKIRPICEAEDVKGTTVLLPDRAVELTMSLPHSRRFRGVKCLIGKSPTAPNCPFCA